MDKALLDSIAGILVDKKDLVSDQGKAQGTVGIALFLFHYYKMSGNEVYGEAVSALVMEMIERITARQELLQRNELLDIAWFLKYLVDQDCLDLEMDELLVSIDDIYADVEYSIGYPNVEYFLKVIDFFVWRREMIPDDQYRPKIDKIITRFVREIVLYYQEHLKYRLLEPGVITNIIQKRQFHTRFRTMISILRALDKVNKHFLLINPQFLNEVVNDLNEVQIGEGKRVQDNGNRCFMSDATTFYIHYTASRCGNNNQDSQAFATGYPQGENLIPLKKVSDLPDLLLATSCLHLLESEKYHYQLPGTIKDRYAETLDGLMVQIISYSALNRLPNMGLKDGIAGAGLLLLILSGNPDPDLENIFPFN
ncbi:hypothetical protein ACTJJ0_09285 [Chitinophaga sp. 22321]|uniref:Uncharacterized protein n=1 Tax=Chitinophaga hostae TaxID=2831022 RepID=A0ABS5IS24_9BACT|nr:hypothetical protein [Chitinophaga hostae]MBS0025736.1 hypothetical protein [Chitinophaga hostae]